MKSKLFTTLTILLQIKYILNVSLKNTKTSECQLTENFLSDESDELTSGCKIYCTESQNSVQIHQECSIYVQTVEDRKIFYDVFKEFKPYVKNITLRGDNVLFLPDSIHKSLPNLVQYNAFACSFKIATYSNFESLKYLKILTFSNGELSDICSTAFDDLVSLYELDLSLNEIKFLHPNLLRNTKNIEKIDISSNMIEILHPRLFQALQFLLILNLSHNQIVFIDNQLFAGNLQLTKLSLEGNNIKIIESLAFENFKNILEFTIHENPCSVNFYPEYVDGYVNMTAINIFINKNCNKINENRQEIEETIMINNRWFGSKYVTEKCGNVDRENYVDFTVNRSDRKLNKNYQFWIVLLINLAIRI